MPPKSASKGKKKKKEVPAVESSNLAAVLKYYQSMCKVLSLDPNPQLLKLLKNKVTEEAESPVQQLILDPDIGALSAGDMKALVSALLANVQSLPGTPYRLLSSLRIWQCTVSNDAAANLSTLIHSPELSLFKFLELVDTRIAAPGFGAIGKALSMDTSTSLLSLKLDCNRDMGDDGAVALCEGLRTNKTLKHLSISFCNVGPASGTVLGHVLGFKDSQLVTLNLQGNKLLGSGFKDLCRGLQINKKLEELNCSDNGLTEDAAVMTALASALQRNKTLTSLDLMFNQIGVSGAEALLPALDQVDGNKTLTMFLIDECLPQHLFDALHRHPDTSKKSGKKKQK